MGRGMIAFTLLLHKIDLRTRKIRKKDSNILLREHRLAIHEIFTAVKHSLFSNGNCDSFHIFVCSKQGGSNEYPQYRFQEK